MIAHSQPARCVYECTANFDFVVSFKFHNSLRSIMCSFQALVPLIYGEQNDKCGGKDRMESSYTYHLIFF